jgi:hypothetical protein
VSSNYFDTLGVPLAAGRAFTPTRSGPARASRSSIVRQRRATLLGQTIKINAIGLHRRRRRAANFTGTMALITPEMWLPLGMFDVVVNDIFKNNGLPFADRRNQTLVVAGRLKPA